MITFYVKSRTYRFDIVPGLTPKSVTPPGLTGQKEISCIGDAEVVVQGRGGGVFLVPTSPSIGIPITLNMTDCQIHIPGRGMLEERIKSTILKNIGGVVNGNEKRDVQIISRLLKIGNEI